jgi:hypothetical protein
MEKTFQVPVWFNIQAKDAETAERMVELSMRAFIPKGAQWVVEEALYIPTEDDVVELQVVDI